MTSVMLSSQREINAKTKAQKKLNKKPVNTNPLILRPFSLPNTTLEKIGPKSKLKTPVNSKTKLNTSRSLLINENVEFYPDRRKRKILMKKTHLHYDFKVVATTNKRKRTIPLREKKLNSPKRRIPDSKTKADEELSVEELVRLVEKQGMDDEDLMEILTCPSPVWWEDTDDEEEIHTRFEKDSTEQEAQTNLRPRLEELYENNNNTTSNNITLTSTNNTGKNLKADINFFKKFVEKRSKLETVLGNIKFKKTKSNTDQSCNKNESDNEINKKVRNDSIGSTSDASINEEDLLNTLENIKIPVLRNENDHEFNKPENNTDLKDNDVEIIGNSIHSVNNVKFICEELKCEENQSNVLYKSKKNSDELNVDSEMNSYEVKTDFKVLSNEVVHINHLEIATGNISPMTNNTYRNVDAFLTCISPKSIDSNASELTHSSLLEYDSISDTNIKFLDEIDEKTEFNKHEILESNVNDTIECNKHEINEFDKNEMNIYKNDKKDVLKNAMQKSDDNKSIIKNKEAELVTVYRILANQNGDVEDEIKINLLNKIEITKKSHDVNLELDKVKNDLDLSEGPNKPNKKSSCRNNKRVKKANVKNNSQRCKKNEKKHGSNDIKTNVNMRTLRVPNTKVNYCLKCSSIFETETCQFCLKKQS